MLLSKLCSIRKRVPVLRHAICCPLCTLGVLSDPAPVANNPSMTTACSNNSSTSKFNNKNGKAPRTAKIINVVVPPFPVCSNCDGVVAANNNNHHQQAQEQPRFSSFKKFQAHLREFHAVALGLNRVAASSSSSRCTKKSRPCRFPLRPRSRSKALLLSAIGSKTSPLLSQRTKRIVLSTCAAANSPWRFSLEHKRRKLIDDGADVASATTEQSTDAVAALAQLYAHIAAGSQPILGFGHYHHHCRHPCCETAFSATTRRNNQPTRQQQQRRIPSSLLFVDFANQPEIFDWFDEVDPGAEIFLRRRAIFIVILEPRVAIRKLFESRFARNAMKCGRIFVHRCRREREAGDVAMADVIVRISCELSSMYRQAHDVVVVDDEGNSININQSGGDFCVASHDNHHYHAAPPKFQIIGNDLRHRRCMQDLLGKDQLISHHSFECTPAHWRSTLKNLLLRCIPCFCGKVTPPDTRFPHEELKIYT